MRRWKLIVCLSVGALYLVGCGQQAGVEPVELVDDAPVIGVWYLQEAEAGRPLAGDASVRFSFEPHGIAAYERIEGDGQEPVRFDLSYNLTGNIISIDSNSEGPGVPRITGKIELSDGGNTLRISTHDEAQWLLTRERGLGDQGEAVSAGESGAAEGEQPMAERVHGLVEACRRYTERYGVAPEAMMDLVLSGMAEAGALTTSGQDPGLPEGFKGMDEAQQEAWLAGHSPFVFFFDYAGSGQASSVLVCTLPVDGRSQVVVGMADGTVYRKPALEVARLLQFQVGHRPGRWPGSAWPLESAAGVGPLSD